MCDMSLLDAVPLQRECVCDMTHWTIHIRDNPLWIVTVTVLL